MKTSPIVPVEPAAVHAVQAVDPTDGAMARAAQVFLRGNGLPERWRGRRRFVVLATGFGRGEAFLATWATWRRDAQRSERLVFIAIEPRPWRAEDLRRVHAGTPQAALAHRLCDAWPPLTANVHPLSFDDGRVTLLLCLGALTDLLRELHAEVDAFCVDDAMSQQRPSDAGRLCKGLGRLAARDATVAAASSTALLHDGLTEAGFVVQALPASDAHPAMTVGRFAPSFVPGRAGSRTVHAMGSEGTNANAARTALVLGAGLAGAAVARALAARGWQCRVLDRRPTPALETSGNPAGLFHGIVTPEDGAHARWHRAAALVAQRCHADRVAQGKPGAVDGLLRLDPGNDAGRMGAMLERLGLPADFVQALPPDAASDVAGVALAAPAWLFPGGGWQSPPNVVIDDLAGIDFEGNLLVDGIRHVDGRWQALAADGTLIGEAPVLVLANANDALRLLDRPAWPVSSVRGQLSVVRSDWQPRVPLAGAGYAIGLGEQGLLCGATLQHHDSDPAIREADHFANLRQLRRLGGPAHDLSDIVDGRVGWRMVADDRMPVIGPMPVVDPVGPRLEQPRFVPRQPGLFTLLALGSRGLTSAPLAGELLAAWIDGDPLPLEGGLIDAVDPARFFSRAQRHRHG